MGNPGSWLLPGPHTAVHACVRSLLPFFLFLFFLFPPPLLQADSKLARYGRVVSLFAHPRSLRQSCMVPTSIRLSLRFSFSFPPAQPWPSESNRAYYCHSQIDGQFFTQDHRSALCEPLASMLCRSPSSSLSVTLEPCRILSATWRPPKHTFRFYLARSFSYSSVRRRAGTTHSLASQPERPVRRSFLFGIHPSLTLPAAPFFFSL